MIWRFNEKDCEIGDGILVRYCKTLPSDPSHTHPVFVMLSVMDDLPRVPDTFEGFASQLAIRTMRFEAQFRRFELSHWVRTA